MCGRFNLTASNQQIIEHFTLSMLANYTLSYNITPGQKILNIVLRADGYYKSANLLWGLVPPWAKDPKVGQKMINARVETLTDKPAYRNAFKRQRCLIPANGFFEWQQTVENKLPFHIHLSNQSLFAFAGVWEQWHSPQQTLYSCTIITTAANQKMQPIHKRMPIIVAPEHYHDWLNTKTQVSTLQQLLHNPYHQNLEFTPISQRVNNPRNNDLACLQ